MPLRQQIVSLVIQLVVAAVVWKHYRARVYPVAAKYATFWPRFWVGSVDACILWPLSTLVVLILRSDAPPAVAATFLLLEDLGWLAYTIIMHAQRGQTVGKIVCRVRVVDHATGRPISWAQAALRESPPLVCSLGLVGYELHLLANGAVSRQALADNTWVNSGPVWLLLMVPMLWFAAEVLTMLTNDKRRALHDLIAGTVVVRTNLA